jgi:hypothetical protein
VAAHQPPNNQAFADTAMSKILGGVSPGDFFDPEILGNEALPFRSNRQDVHISRLQKRLQPFGPAPGAARAFE